MTPAFKPLPLPQKKLPALSGYRVYSDATNFKVVQAGSALEALQASGLKEAYRIERESIALTNVLDLRHVPNTEEAPPPPPAPPEAAAAEIPVVAAPPQEAKAEPLQEAKAEPPTPLSSDQVDQLLQPGASAS